MKLSGIVFFLLLCNFLSNSQEMELPIDPSTGLVMYGGAIELSKDLKKDSVYTITKSWILKAFKGHGHNKELIKMDDKESGLISFRTVFLLHPDGLALKYAQAGHVHFDFHIKSMDGMCQFIINNIRHLPHSVGKRQQKFKENLLSSPKPECDCISEKGWKSVKKQAALSFSQVISDFHNYVIGYGKG